MKIPGFFVVELTNRCNLRCPACPWHTCMKREIRDISLEEYRIILDKISPYAEAVCFYVMGEPFLNQHLELIISETHKRGIRTIISTNGMLLKENMPWIFEVGLDYIQVALDGFTAESHEAYRKGSDFNQIMQGLNLISVKKKEGGYTKPEIALQTLVNRYNEQEITRIEEYAQKSGFTFHTKKMHYGREKKIQEINEKQFKPSSSDYLRQVGKSYYSNGGACPELDKVVILSNGVVVACCIDYDGKTDLGNIFTQSLEQIWEGAKRKEFLKAYVERKNSFCEKCDMI